MNIYEIRRHYSIHSDDQSNIICKLIDRLERLEAGLTQINNMRNATQIKGGLFDIGMPKHLIDDDGFVPIHPSVLDGLKLAANVAREALEK